MINRQNQSSVVMQSAYKSYITAEMLASSESESEKDDDTDYFSILCFRNLKPKWVLLMTMIIDTVTVLRLIGAITILFYFCSKV